MLVIKLMLQSLALAFGDFTSKLLAAPRGGVIGTGGSRDLAFKCVCISVLSAGLWHCNQWSPSVL